MSTNFADFWNKVVGGGGTQLLAPATADQIKSAMEIIYNLQSKNPDAAAIISGLESDPFGLTFVAGTQWLADPATRIITVRQAPGFVGGAVPVPTFNDVGQWVTEPLYKTLAHELAHLVLGKDDPPIVPGDPLATVALAKTTSDLLGGAELVANSIAASQGDSWAETASYFLTGNPALMPDLVSFNPNVSYTFGNSITSGYSIASVASRAQYSASYTLDRSAFKENDLLIGGNGSDTIYGAQGNNYICGNGGNDVIFPGTGNNVVDGGD
jgi:Ca2+-binding RTX toxin-like protein